MSTNNNNSAEIIVKGSNFQEGRLDREDNYPDPNTLPLPSQEQRITDVTLSELIQGRYVSVTARVVYLRAIEKQDALGSKMIFSGILEDSEFKVPFVSHRISYPLIRNCVYKFQSAYVHEFPEKSLLLVITEYTKISPKDVEDYREYIWKRTVDSIKRPVKSVALQGVITTVHSNSGMIKRCNSRYSLTTLGRVVYDAHMIIGKALSYYSRLKAIESIEMSYGAAFPKEELARLIDSLIDDHQIKDMIMKRNSGRLAKEDTKMQLI